VGIAPVADERLDKLHALYPESKKITAIVEFVDIAGLVKNAHKGEGLGNQFLSNVRNVDVILEVVRVFRNTDIEHVEKSVDPKRDIGIIRSELILSDLELIRKRKERVAKEKRGLGKEKEAAEIEWDILEVFENKLNNEEWLCPLPGLPDKLVPYARDIIKNFSLLTTKPILYVLNGAGPEEAAALGLEEANYVIVDAKLEKEMNDISSEERDELELKSQLDNLVRHSYDLLGLLTFFTSGDKETRAWEAKRGAPAPQAAGVIHSDFEKNFISANVISWEKLLEAGSWKKARELGQIRREGKEYVMQEGDVVEFLIGK